MNPKRLSDEYLATFKRDILAAIKTFKVNGNKISWRKVAEHMNCKYHTFMDQKRKLRHVDNDELDRNFNSVYALNGNTWEKITPNGKVNICT